MLIIESLKALAARPPGQTMSGDDADKAHPLGSASYSVPFEILGEPIVPGVAQVPLVLQGTFIQVTSLTPGVKRIELTYVPTQPFVAAPEGGKVKLNANAIDVDLKIYNLTHELEESPKISWYVPGNGTIIVGVQYVATGLSLAAGSIFPTEPAGNRGIVHLKPEVGATFLATATIRQFFVSQQGSPLVPIAASAYSVPIGGGPLIAG